jgi:hypothetical protein
VGKIFPGFPEFLDRAAAVLDVPEARLEARRVPSVAAVANLCAQADRGDTERALQILEQAQGILDQLRVATLGVEMMLAQAFADHGIGRSEKELSKAAPVSVCDSFEETGAFEAGRGCSEGRRSTKRRKS